MRWQDLIALSVLFIVPVALVSWVCHRLVKLVRQRPFNWEEMGDE